MMLSFRHAARRFLSRNTGPLDVSGSPGARSLCGSFPSSGFSFAKATTTAGHGTRSYSSIFCENDDTPSTFLSNTPSSLRTHKKDILGFGALGSSPSPPSLNHEAQPETVPSSETEIWNLRIEENRLEEEIRAQKEALVSAKAVLEITEENAALPTAIEIEADILDLETEMQSKQGKQKARWEQMIKDGKKKLDALHKFNLLVHSLPKLEEQLAENKKRQVVLEAFLRDWDKTQIPERNAENEADVKELVKSLVSWCSFKGIVKKDKDYQHPYPLASSPFNPVEREDLLVEALIAFRDRNRLRRKDKNPSDRINNPLNSVQSAPGIGKSYALTLIASLGCNVAEIRRLNTDHNIGLDEREIVQIIRSVGLTVTCNSGFSRIDRENKDNWDEFFGWRIVCSYFTAQKDAKLDGKGTLFSSMIANFREVTKMSTDFALKIVGWHQMSLQVKEATAGEDLDYHIILCVDEISKSVNPEALIHKLGNILDNNENVNIVTSTLDQYFIKEKIDISNNQTPGSNRTVVWLSLPLISLKGALSMFASHNPEKNVDLLRCICLANGHARTLQFIDLTLNKLQGKSTSELFNTISRELYKWLDSRDYTWEIVCAALKGKPIQPKKKFFVAGEEQEAKDLVASGYFINSRTAKVQKNKDEEQETEKEKEPEKDLFIPRMSLFHIQSYFLDKIQQSNTIFKPLSDLINLSPPMDDPRVRGFWFEMFFSHWERLTRLVLHTKEQSGNTPFDFDQIIERNKEISLIKDIYGLTELDDSSPLSVDDYTSKHGAFVFGRDVKINLTLTPDGTSKHYAAIVTLPELNESSFNTVYYLGGDNKGFDTLILERTPSGSPIAVFIEFKYSSPKDSSDNSAKTNFKSAEMFDKIKNTVTFFEETLMPASLAFRGKLEKKQPQDNFISEPFSRLNQIYFVAVSFHKPSFSFLKGLRGDLINIQSENPPSPSRDYPASFFNKGKFLPNIVVLEKERILELLGPTLSYVPEFTFTGTPTAAVATKAQPAE